MDGRKGNSVIYTVERYAGDILARQISSNLVYAGKFEKEILKPEPGPVRVYNENGKLILEGHWRDIMPAVRRLP